MAKLVILWATTAFDRRLRSRVLVVCGRDLLVNAHYPRDPEFWQMRREPGYSVRCVASIRHVSTAGIETVERVELQPLVERFPGGQPYWEAARVQRFLVPEDVTSPAFVFEYVRNDGATVTFAAPLVAVPLVPAVGVHFASREVVPYPVVVRAGETLSNTIVDLTATGTGKPAVIFEPGASMVDCGIINPWGPAIGGDGFERVRLERVDIKALAASELSLSRPVQYSSIVDTSFSGPGGWRPGEFGVLLSGGRLYLDRVSISGFARGPVMFQRRSALADSFFSEVSLDRIGPINNGEGEGILWEGSEGEYPTSVDWISSTRLRVDVRSRFWLARVGAFVVDKRTRERAEIVTASGMVPGFVELGLSSPLSSAFARRAMGFDLRVGAVLSGATFARCEARDSKHLFSFAGPTVDSHLLDCRAWYCAEPWSYNAEAAGPMASREPPAVVENFGWDGDAAAWGNVVRFFASHGCARGVYRQVGPRVDPDGWQGCGYRGEWKHG